MLYAGMSKVSIADTKDHIYKALVKASDDIGVRLIRPGDYMLMKPNLVEPAASASG
jgi:uncharacterized protein (DUF362 family)